MSKTYEALKRAEALRAKRRAGDADVEAPREPEPDLPVNSADDYYELRRRLLSVAVSDSIKSIMVVSALHGEGASNVSVLLGKALAERSRNKTLLVDLNLRTPTLWRLMQAKGKEGFTSVVSKEKDVPEVIQETNVDSLGVITAGNGYVDAIDIIDNESTFEAISALNDHADVVIVDCAPVTLYPDARALAAIVDGVVLVVEADVTPVGVANRAVDLIREAGGNLLGVVLNKRHDYIPPRVLQLIG